MAAKKLGRSDACPCGSGEKHRRCRDLVWRLEDVRTALTDR